MKRAGTAMVVLFILVLALVGCKAKRGSAGKAGGEGEPAGGTVSPAPERGGLAHPCPECNGRGLSPYSGDDRPCFLCDGDGRCARCGGDGRTEGEVCSECDGTGLCSECGGDARITFEDRGRAGERSLLPGLCPLCRDGLGLCPGCGGSGTLARGRVCALCAGGGGCPECGGSGEDPLSDGTAVCLSCRGHGSILDGEPGPGWPDFRLVDSQGRVILCRLVEVSADSISLARTSSSDAPVETLAADRIAPICHYLARLRFLDPLAPEARRIAAGVAARYRELAGLARRDLTLGLEPSAAAVPEPRKLGAERTLEAGLIEAAKAALERGHAPGEAWVLLETALRAFPSGAMTEDATVLRDRAAALLGNSDAASPETAERRRLAENAWFERALRRAAWWRGRAERLAGRTGAGCGDFQRAERAAREAWRTASAAANRSPPEGGGGRGREEAGRDSAIRARALVGLAARLLEDELAERARAVAIRALAVHPDDEGARRFAAAVAEALVRRAAEGD